MSDYLSNIAAKALNLIPLIEPRPIALFEPTPGPEGAFDHPSIDRGVDPASDAAALPAAPAAEPQPRQSQRFTRRLANDHDRHADTTPPVAAPTVSVGRMPGVWSTAQGTPSATSAIAAVPPVDAFTSATAYDSAPTTMRPASSQTLGSLAQNRRAPLVASPAQPTVVAAESDAPPEPWPSSGVSASSSPQDDTSTGRAFRLDMEARGAQRTHPTTGAIVVQALVTPAGESAAHAEAETTTPQAAQPTIKVNIGRVEVRAIISPTPAAPRPKAARPTPKPSLADYLQSSHRGR